MMLGISTPGVNLEFSLLISAMAPLIAMHPQSTHMCPYGGVLTGSSRLGDGSTGPPNTILAVAIRP